MTLNNLLFSIKNRFMIDLIEYPNELWMAELSHIIASLPERPYERAEKGHLLRIYAQWLYEEMMSHAANEEKRETLAKRILSTIEEAIDQYNTYFENNSEVTEEMKQNYSSLIHLGINYTALLNDVMNSQHSIYNRVFETNLDVLNDK